jgi:vacuolar-type H+-ATPase subunit F/Vma7
VSRLVALGEHARVDAFALVGVQVIPAETAADARAAWTALEPDIGVVILSPAARKAIADLLSSRPDVIWTAIPD